MKALLCILGIVVVSVVILFCLGLAAVIVARARQKLLDFDDDDKIV